MALRDEIARDHRESDAREGDRVHWSGEYYPCRLGSIDVIKELQDGGHVVAMTARVHMRLRSRPGDRCQWNWTETGGPQEGDTVAIGMAGPYGGITNPKTAKVGNVHRISEVVLAFDCEDLTK